MSFAVWTSKPPFEFGPESAEQIHAVGEVWVVTDDPQRATQAEVDTVLATQATVARMAAIDAARDAALAGSVTWNGRPWHIDNTFQTHLTAFISAFGAGLLPPNATVSIRAADETTQQLGLAELKQLGGAVMLKVQQIWAQSWAAKDAP